MRQNTQEDIVRDQKGYVPETITERVTIPGIETLHERPSDEIAEALAIIIRSRNNITAIRYELGKFIELTLVQPLVQK
jgi:hypothetical protein